VLPEPAPGPHDLLVDIRAISVNPVDTKVRQSSDPTPGETKVLGWDAAGVVRAAGEDVTLFRPGDNVWYAGSIARPGTNSEQHVVDERIAGKMPASLSFAQASGGVVSVPLTVQTPGQIALSTPLSDVSPGSNPVITATVFDGGKPAANAWVSFAITVDGSSHGSLSAVAFPARTLWMGRRRAER